MECRQVHSVVLSCRSVKFDYEMNWFDYEFKMFNYEFKGLNYEF